MNTLLKMIERAKEKERSFVGGELFENAHNLPYSDADLAGDILQELAAVLSDLGEKYEINVDELVIDNLKEYHEDWFNIEDILDEPIDDYFIGAGNYSGETIRNFLEETEMIDKVKTFDELETAVNEAGCGN